MTRGQNHDRLELEFDVPLSFPFATKAGDTFLRHLLVECAHYILSPNAHDTDLKRWGLKLAERGGKVAKKRAAAAVARKLSILLLRLWTTGEIYEPLRSAARRGEPKLALSS